MDEARDTCPQCGGPTVIDDTARELRDVIGRWNSAAARIERRWFGVVLCHCARCEWSQVIGARGVLEGCEAGSGERWPN